jgi:hypothetical protein
LALTGSLFVAIVNLGAIHRRLLDHTAEFATFTGGAGGYTYYFWARNETGTGTQITLCAARRAS